MLRAVVLACVLASVTAAAHPLAPGLLDVRELGDGRVAVGWKMPLAVPRDVALAPDLPCRTLTTPVMVEVEGGRRTDWTADCGGGLVGLRIGVRGLVAPLTAVVRVTLADGRVAQRVIDAASPSLVVPGRPSRWDVVGSYGALGFWHVLSGADHLLFVLGLVLLGGNVLLTVTAFTVGHSLTLSLAALGLVSVPVRPVEVAIALSVLWLAIELARPVPSALGRRPWLLAATFGLLHGLGFASALREAGLPAGEIPLALLAFNLGIEAGQVGVVLLLVVGAHVVRPVMVSAPAWAQRVPVYVMGALAAFWCFARAFG
ncbi:MAG TPA: HupE/UreJ family protein [Candidatus Binatia bacterium]|nr:HupE/UreJ family protein [Candidatus Binatia bacterium]